ncbi:hypothetical protein COO60DRAFT_1167839 [Scenedesmus sp. NREL 46B-D3]|nr:hypothetical protein COO60DRAFT_1167839 [Scenedesmus sp. NREL 46B-D3]
MALDDDGPSRKAVLLSYPGLAESHKAATGSEFLISKSEMVGMFKSNPGLGAFILQASTHVFAAAPGAEAAGADAVLTRVISGRASVMVVWVDQLPEALVAALEAAVRQPTRHVQGRSCPSQEGSATDDSEQPEDEAALPEQPTAAQPSDRQSRLNALLRGSHHTLGSHSICRALLMAPAPGMLARASHELRQRM